jgi:hypothetical protein
VRIQVWGSAYNWSVSDHRKVAIARLQELRDLLSDLPAEHEGAALVGSCDTLVRSIEAFHVEAIRFRMYGLARQLTKLSDNLPGDTTRLIGEAREALAAAGFHT